MTLFGQSNTFGQTTNFGGMTSANPNPNKDMEVASPPGEPLLLCDTAQILFEMQPFFFTRRLHLLPSIFSWNDPVDVFARRVLGQQRPMLGDTASQRSDRSQSTAVNAGSNKIYAHYICSSRTVRVFFSTLYRQVVTTSGR